MATEHPHVRLLRDHEDIAVLLQRLLVAFDSGDRPSATAAFKAFDRRLSSHLAFEDAVLLPKLAAIDRHAADRLAAEHMAIRARVEELAIEDNLHVSRASEVHRLAELLRVHAQNEEEALYPLADRPDLRERLEQLLDADSPSLVTPAF